MRLDSISVAVATQADSPLVPAQLRTPNGRGRTTPRASRAHRFQFMDPTSQNSSKIERMATCRKIPHGITAAKVICQITTRTSSRCCLIIHLLFCPAYTKTPLIFCTKRHLTNYACSCACRCLDVVRGSAASHELFAIRANMGCLTSMTSRSTTLQEGLYLGFE